MRYCVSIVLDLITQKIYETKSKDTIKDKQENWCILQDWNVPNVYYDPNPPYAVC